MRKLEQNWKRWKEDRQSDKNEYLRRIEEKEEGEKKKMYERDRRTGHFSGGEILKGGNVKIAESGLHCFLFSYSYFLFFLIYFHFLF